MNNNEFERLAGHLAKIAYHISDNEGVDTELSDMLLDLWREFSHYIEEEESQ